MFESYAIDIVLNVGANSDQFDQELSGEYIGSQKKIISFEPLGSVIYKY